MPFALAAFALTVAWGRETAPYDAVVDVNYEGAAGAVVQGIITFASIGEAIASVSVDNERPYVIFIRNGRYEEKLTIDRPNVQLLGESRDKTIISHGDSGDTIGSDGQPLGTRGSYTLRVIAPDFHAENLTIENSFDYPDNALKDVDDQTRVRNPQAVAVMTDGASDRTVFRNCTIVGYQDTLFVNAGRHYFFGCRITGHVDFIFGAGTTVFEDCDVVSRNRANKNPTGYVTAPSTLATNAYGLVFVASRLIKESTAVPEASVRLGRPWHPKADPNVDGSAVFINCYMDDHIGPEGYARISAVDSTGRRIWFQVGPNSRFFEYGSYGPGARLSPDRPVLDGEAAGDYAIGRVLSGWDVTSYRQRERVRPASKDGS